jgi:hypothetical protein
MAKSKFFWSSKTSGSSELKTPKRTLHDHWWHLPLLLQAELLGQRCVDQSREFSHRHYIRDTDKTPKQLLHSVTDVTTAQSATIAIVTTYNKDLPHQHPLFCLRT